MMRAMMAEANLSLPTFESNHSRDEFVATLLMHHFLDAEDMAWLAQFQQHNLWGMRPARSSSSAKPERSAMRRIGI